jgi:hypothetical protein
MIKVISLMRIITAFLFVLMISSCKKMESSNEFTLKSGVNLLSVSACLNGAPESNYVNISQESNIQIVSMNWYFSCNEGLDSPYLSVSRNNMQTLTLKNGKHGGSCECQKIATVEIKNRIADGTSLYVVVNGEVVAQQLIKN